MIYIRFFLSLGLLSLLACQSAQKEAAPRAPASMDTLRIALDWSPNILHAGIFLAEARGEFERGGLRIDWFTPEVDDYRKKPIRRLLDGEVDLSIGPSEHLFYYAADSASKTPRAEAVASLLSQPQSAFAVKATADIYSPSDWSDIEYIGYDTPLEEAILEAMVKQSGREQAPSIIQPGRLQVWDAFLERPEALVWIFTHWEGQMCDEPMRYFYPQEWGVPYGYSSVLMARIRKFLSIIRTSYQILASAEKDQRPALAHELTAYLDHPNYSSDTLLLKAWSDIQAAFYADRPEAWGQMELERWQQYLDWIQTHDLINTNRSFPGPEKWFSNDLLDPDTDLK